MDTPTVYYVVLPSGTWVFDYEIEEAILARRQVPTVHPIEPELASVSLEQLESWLEEARRQPLPYEGLPKWWWLAGLGEDEDDLDPEAICRCGAVSDGDECGVCGWALCAACEAVYDGLCAVCAAEARTL
jgi:hypothetical protein